MHLAKDKTPIWPADWSSFIPDALIAVFTGVLVGLVVLWVERSISRSRERRLASRQQFDAVEQLATALLEPFTYNVRDHLPDEKPLLRVQAAVANVQSGPATPSVPGYYFLRSILKAWEELRTAADALVQPTRDAVRSSPGQEVLVRQFIEDYARHSSPVWSIADVSPTVKAAVESSADFRQAVEDYRAARIILDATREAFNASDTRWRIDSFVIMTYAHTDGPVPFLSRWWRRIRAPLRRRRARDKADQSGYDVMKATGVVWFRPRVW